MRRAMMTTAAVLLLCTGAAAAADLPEDQEVVALGGTADEAVLVNGRQSAMIDVVLGAASTPGYAAKSTRYVKPGASLPLKLVPASPCEQTVIAKFADGYTVHRSVNVCAGPVTIGDR